MDKFLDKIFFRSKNLNYISKNIKNISENTPAKKIFEAINNYSENSELRFVGGCIRKIINREEVDDIDLATNITPDEVCEALNKNEIKFFESGKEHGTITAVINEQNYEITSLRKDVATDGRHAKVEFTSDWKEDSKRRDFTINAIYSDSLGNLFDPQNGKLDLEKGILKFIGDPEKRIQEDYLRILRYFRFHINYSNENHKTEIIKIFKKNIKGISNLSAERLLDEFKKIVKSKNFLKLLEDQQSLEILEIVFPQFKNINHFKKLNSFSSKAISSFDFIFIIALLIIDETDNTDYFLYKFKISKKDQINCSIQVR